MRKKILVYMIPTYNENGNILKMLVLVENILSRLLNYQSYILVVDDKSPDGTPEIVKSFQKNHTNIILLSGLKNGLGAAMIRGYRYAIKKLHADVLVSNEADFSYNPAEVIPMVKRIEKGADVIFASRKLSDVYTWSKNRQFIHWIANEFFANWIAGVNEVQDHNSAFKAIKVKGILDKINFYNFPRGFAFFNYFTFKLLNTTQKYYEITTTYHPRTRGDSKISLNSKYFKTFVRDSIEYVLVSFSIRFERLNS